MDPNFQPRKRARYRGDPVTMRIVPVPPPADAVYATVGHSGGQAFTWFFDAPFADPTGPLTPADLAGLWVGGLPPVAVDEVIGQDGTITLIYDLQDPDAPDIQFEVNAAPAVLHFEDDRPLAVPQNGYVGA